MHPHINKYIYTQIGFINFKFLNLAKKFNLLVHHLNSGWQFHFLQLWLLRLAQPSCFWCVFLRVSKKRPCRSSVYDLLRAEVFNG